jgi:uncharacterized protein YfdQ (DUF2303 family)
MPKPTESTSAFDAVHAVMTKAERGQPVTRDNLMEFMGVMLKAHKGLKQRLERVERQLSIRTDPEKDNG